MTKPNSAFQTVLFYLHHPADLSLFFFEQMSPIYWLFPFGVIFVSLETCSVIEEQVRRFLASLKINFSHVQKFITKTQGITLSFSMLLLYLITK